MIKRGFSLLFCAVLLFTAFLPAAATALTPCGFESFSASALSIEVGNCETVGFTAVLDYGAPGRIEVQNAEGAHTAYLYREENGGAAGDACVYYGEALLSADNWQTEEYFAVAGLAKSEPYEIVFYNELTEADWQAHDAVWESIRAVEADFDVYDPADDAAALEAVYNCLAENEEVENVWLEDDTTLNFELNSGIGNIYSHFNNDTKSSVGSVDYVELIGEQLDETDCVRNANIGVWSPYYGYDSDFTTEYIDRARACAPLINGKVTGFYGSSANYETFKRWNEFGVVMIDSHGTMFAGKATICIPKPGEYDENDVAERIIYSMGADGIAITGGFFRKYCPDMPNTLVYMGICYGMMNDSLSAPLLELGASFCIGYDEAVTFAYDVMMMNLIFRTLCEEKPGEGRLHTAGEACEEAKRRYGSKDPWSDAYIQTAGNGDTLIKFVQVPVDSFSLNQHSIDLYRNNTLQLAAVTTPVSANNYKLEWSSSNPSAVSVDNKGLITAKAQGEAVIACVLTDNANGGAKLNASCTVRVVGDMAVSGIDIYGAELVMYLPGGKAQLDANALPANATNRSILWSSRNESVAKVDSNGIVSAVGAGVTVLIAETEDGGYRQGRVCRVAEPDIASAACKGNIRLVLKNDEKRPWVIDASSFSDRAAMRSNTSGMGKTSTVFTFNAGHLEAADSLTFDWKVSSEIEYDTLAFAVNGVNAAEISGNTEWEAFEYRAAEAGEYVFTWTYSKDESVNIGFDCGWVDEICVNRAQTSEKSVETRFIDMDGSVLFTHRIPAFSDIIHPCDPYRSGYTFIGWDKSGAINTDTDVYAVYAEGEFRPQEGLHTVTFVDGSDGSVISRVFVRSGDDARLPSREYLNSLYQKPFLGWETEARAVSSDMAVKGVFAFLGDVNGDGKTDAGDASFVLKVCAKMITKDRRMEIVGDANRDGALDVGDAAWILRFVAGLEGMPEF